MPYVEPRQSVVCVASCPCFSFEDRLCTSSPRGRAATDELLPVGRIFATRTRRNAGTAREPRVLPGDKTTFASARNDACGSHGDSLGLPLSFCEQVPRPSIRCTSSDARAGSRTRSFSSCLVAQLSWTGYPLDRKIGRFFKLFDDPQIYLQEKRDFFPICK